MAEAAGGRLTEAQFLANAILCGNNYQTGLRIAADAAHDHEGNILRPCKPDDADSSLMDYLRAIDTRIRATVAAPANPGPIFSEMASTFNSSGNKNGPTGNIHKYLSSSREGYLPATMLAQSPGKDLKDITEILRKYGVRYVITDSIKRNPYAYDLGSDLFQLTHLETITTRLDAASTTIVKESPSVTVNKTLELVPFTVRSFYEDKQHTFDTVEDDAGKRINSLTITGADGSDPLHLHCEKGFSVNAINTCVGLPGIRGSGESGSTITIYKEDADTNLVQVVPGALTKEEIGDVLLAKQCMDYGQFYQATRLSRITPIENNIERVLLVTCDKYFRKQMESCSYLQGGFVLVMDNQENVLYCIDPEHNIDQDAAVASIVANIGLLGERVAGAAMTPASQALYDSAAAQINSYKKGDLFKNPFTYLFVLSINHIIQNISKFLQVINKYLDITVETVDIVLVEDREIVNQLAGQTASAVIDGMINRCKQYIDLISDTNMRIARIRNRVSNDADKAEDIINEIHQLITSINLPEDIRSKLLGIWCSYIDVPIGSQRDIIYQRLVSLDTDSANYYIYAFNVHARTGAWAGQKKIAISMFFDNTGDTASMGAMTASLPKKEMPGGAIINGISVDTIIPSTKYAEIPFMDDTIAVGSQVNVINSDYRDTLLIRTLRNSLIEDEVVITGGSASLLAATDIKGKTKGELLAFIAMVQYELQAIKTADMPPLQRGTLARSLNKSIKDATKIIDRMGVGIIKKKKGKGKYRGGYRQMGGDEPEVDAMAGITPDMEDGEEYDLSDNPFRCYNIGAHEKLSELVRMYINYDTRDKKDVNETLETYIKSNFTPNLSLPEFLDVLLKLLPLMEGQAVENSIIGDYTVAVTELENLCLAYLSSTINADTTVDQHIENELFVIGQIFCYILLSPGFYTLFMSLTQESRLILLNSLLSSKVDETAGAILGDIDIQRRKARGNLVKARAAGVPSLAAGEMASLNAVRSALISDHPGLASPVSATPLPKTATLSTIANAAKRDYMKKQEEWDPTIFGPSSSDSGQDSSRARVAVSRGGSRHRRSTKSRRHLRRTRRLTDAGKARRKQTRRSRRD